MADREPRFPPSHPAPPHSGPHQGHLPLVTMETMKQHLFTLITHLVWFPVHIWNTFDRVPHTSCTKCVVLIASSIWCLIASSIWCHHTESGKHVIVGMGTSKSLKSLHHLWLRPAGNSAGEVSPFKPNKDIYSFYGTRCGHGMVRLLCNKDILSWNRYKSH